MNRSRCGVAGGIYPGLRLCSRSTSHPRECDIVDIRVGPLLDAETETLNVDIVDHSCHSEVPSIVGVQTKDSDGHDRWCVEFGIKVSKVRILAAIHAWGEPAFSGFT